MKTFLSLITRDEFSALYKFGSIDLSTKILREVAEAKDIYNIAFELLKRSVCLVEYPQEYIYVLIQKNTEQENNGIVRILDIVALIPLTEQAKYSYEELFDKAICFQHPLFAQKFEEYYTDIYLKRDRIEGIKALRSICGLSADDLDSIFIDQIFDGVRFRQQGTKYFNIPRDKRSPFSMLIAYDRYQEYSKQGIGYFYDVVDMCYYLVSPDNIGDRDESIIDQEVAEILGNRQGKIDGICKDIENDSTGNGKKVCDEVAKQFGSFYLPVLYLSFKDMIRGKNEIDATIIDNLKKYQKEEEMYDKITYLLGGFFGYEKIYECYYKSLNLNIFSRDLDVNEFMNSSANLADTKVYSHNNVVEKSPCRKSKKSVVNEGCAVEPLSDEDHKERIMKCVKQVTTSSATLRSVNDFLSRDTNYKLLIGFLTGSSEVVDCSKLIESDCHLTKGQLSKLRKKYNSEFRKEDDNLLFPSIE